MSLIVRASAGIAFAILIVLMAVSAQASQDHQVAAHSAGSAKVDYEKINRLRASGARLFVS